MHYNTPVIIEGMCILNKEEVFIKRIRQNAGYTTATKLPKDENILLLKKARLFEADPKQLLPILSYHGTGRLWEQENKKTSSMENLSRLDGYKDCLSSKSNYRNLKTWFAKMEFNAFQLSKKIPILEVVRDTVKEMLSMLTKKEIELFIYREGDLEIKYKDEERREKVSNLSDGYKNMIGIVSDIAYRIAILNPHLGIPFYTTNSKEKVLLYK
ncbi:MAG: hypothetical protein Q9M36_05995 [Sulfurovum sp.]|nr:hypothetical protein [Sulfurovum sp.]